MSSNGNMQMRAFSNSEKLRLRVMYGTVVGIHLLGWGLLIWESRWDSTLPGLGILAYGFGLRHAFDADHISAVDSTTRKLLQSGKRPLGVGLYFSLGHSLVVLFIALVIGLAVKSAVYGIAGDKGALLALSAGAATRGLSVAAVLALPLIFASGMSLLDSTDGVFMARAYTWAFTNPVRRLFYNLTVTALSVFAAMGIGVVEVLQVVSRLSRSDSGVWRFIEEIDLGRVGYFMVAVFAVTWIAAAMIFRFRRIEERWVGTLSE